MVNRPLSLPADSPDDPRTVPPGVYQAGYRGRTVTVHGPDRLYPSGLRYFRIAGTSEYVPAAHLEWIAPSRTNTTARIIRRARRGFASLGEHSRRLLSA